MLNKLLYFFVNLLPKSLRKIFDRYEEQIVYIYYGVLTTLVNLIVQYGVQFGILSQVPWNEQFEVTLSTDIAWCVAVVFGFYVNKRYVFKSKTMEKKGLAWEFLSFTGGRVLTLLAENGIMLVGSFFYHDAETDTDNFWIFTLFKFIAQVVVTLSNYFISKLIVFRKKKTEAE